MAEPWYMPKAAPKKDNLAAALSAASALSRQLSGWKTGTLAPVERNIVTGDLRPAVPMFVQDAVRGAMAPGKALRGEYGLAASPDGRVSYDGMMDDAAALAGSVTLGAGAIPRPAGVLDMGFKAYHGSPHDFDKFSLNKIGTGEGAQAYGHGLYFAENPAIANAYRDQLARPYLQTSDGMDLAKQYGDDIQQIFESSGGDPDELRRTVARLRALVDKNLQDAGAKSINDLRPSEYDGDFPSVVRQFASRADRLEKLVNSGDVQLVNAGRIYEVDIDAETTDFIDWDKPLTEQPKAVLDALGMDPNAEKVTLPNGERVPPAQLYGRDIWRAFNEGARGMPDEAQAALRSKGIKGIRYLDAGSRGAGDGSRNFVVFDDNLISILSKK